MKKRLFFITILLMVTTLIVGCGDNNKSNNNKSESRANNVLNDTKNSDSKVLVVYFSKNGENYNVGNVSIGNTAMMASYIKEYLGADSFEIVPVKKYSDDYDTATEEAKKEQNENARPKIKNSLDNFDNYNTIFIGYPIWWGDLPMIVYTFLEEYDFNDKTVIPFNTHEGSGDAGTYLTIKNKLSNARVNTKGLALQGSVAREEEGKKEVYNWLKELGYIDE